MNNARRKRVESIITKTESVQMMIESVLMEEEFCMDNFPENLTESDRYQAISDSVDRLSEASDGISSVVESLRESIS